MIAVRGQDEKRRRPRATGRRRLSRDAALRLSLPHRQLADQNHFPATSSLLDFVTTTWTGAPPTTTLMKRASPSDASSDGDSSYENAEEQAPVISQPKKKRSRKHSSCEPVSSWGVATAVRRSESLPRAPPSVPQTQGKVRQAVHMRQLCDARNGVLVV